MNVLDVLKGGWQQNKIEILTGLSIVGTALTGILSFKAGRKVEPILEEARKDMQYVRRGDKEARNDVIKETAKEVVPVVLPSILIGGATIATIIGTTKETSRHIAVLTAAYAISEKTAKDLNDKLVEVIGEKKAQRIRDKVVEDKVKRRLKDEEVPEFNTSRMKEGVLISNRDVLCMDVYSGRSFYADPEKIRQCILELSATCQSDMYVSLNDLYDLINSPDLPPIPMGNDFGWNVDYLYKGMIPVEFSSILLPNQKPCLCIDYTVSPRADFRHLY